jgi:hypothetical protein
MVVKKKEEEEEEEEEQDQVRPPGDKISKLGTGSSASGAP